MSVEKRKKEVALRKINGAVFKDIIILFSKTYFRLWTFSCIVSFPLIYYVAIRWLERYKEQISIPVWLFGLIYLVILALIVATVVSQLIKAFKTNPADELKNE
jgi:hypothetical protein